MLNLEHRLEEKYPFSSKEIVLIQGKYPLWEILWAWKNQCCVILVPFWKNDEFEELVSHIKPHHKIHENLIPLEGHFKINFETLNFLRPPSFDFEATMIFTSGSQGKPKGVIHTYKQHLEAALASNMVIPLSHQDVWVLNLAFFHVGGLAPFFRCIQKEASLMTMDGSLPPFLGTHLSCVPYQLEKWMENQEALKRLKNYKAILLGGDSCPDFLWEKIQKENLNVYLTYGCTEAASQIATSFLKKRNLYLLPHIQIKQDDSSWIKGPSVSCYHWKEGKIEPALQKDWYPLQDTLKVVDDEIIVLGRKDRVFQCGGENIDPQRIENVIGTFYRGFCRVLGFPHPSLGQVPVAFLNVEDKNLLLKKLETVLLKHEMPREILPFPQKEGKPSLEDFYNIFINKKD